MPASVKAIQIRGVRQNNLKNLSLNIPIGKFTVVTGLSGTGKSSLVFDTLHAEGQRRYVETFNAYTRQFLEMLPRPEVDEMRHVRPSIAIEQKNSVRTSRSTVGTMTELCDYCKVFFAHVATLIDPDSGHPIYKDEPQTVWKRMRKELQEPDGHYSLCFSISGKTLQKLTPQTVIRSLLAKGYTRCWLQGKLLRLKKDTDLSVRDSEILYVVQDRISFARKDRNRFFESVETTFENGSGKIQLIDDKGHCLHQFHRGLQSPVSGRIFQSPKPALFSYNSPVGACPTCRGFGRVIGIRHSLVIPDENLSLREGAIRPFQGQVYSNSLEDLIRYARTHGLRLDVPWKDLSAEEQRFVWEGEPDYPAEDDEEWMNRWYGINRFFEWLERNSYKMHVRVFLSKYRSYDQCPVCTGDRLCEEARCWKWEGHTLPDLYRMEIRDLRALLESHPSLCNKETIPGLDQILKRLGYLDEIGLGYLTLDRQTRTLSGGETERVNLTTCLGTSMVDTLFVLDEPSVGLHPKDIDQLIRILRELTNQGNTVVVVEHDERIMRAADHLIELGPEPGRKGGSVVFEGSLSKILRSPHTWTGKYLAGIIDNKPTLTGLRKPEEAPFLRIEGASIHNLKNLNVEIPMGCMVGLSGVSGSGKSTLLNQVIYQNLLLYKGQPANDPATIRDLDCPVPLGEMVYVDQTGISRTPRSNPALFCGAWEEIRKLYANTDEAKSAGMTASTFSFNSGEGRCPHCQGLGYEKVEMQFLSDIYVPCPVCEGKRFQPPTRAIHWQGKSIDELLAMDIRDAIDFFDKHRLIVDKLRPIQSVGLEYLSMGQPLNTLSGGEAQRLKLIRHLGKSPRSKGSHTLLLIDEPTTGLHRHDIRKLLDVFQVLVQEGNTLIIVEHHPDILKSVDWLIEMGPGAGSMGGRIVSTGLPLEASESSSPTREYPLAAESPLPYNGSLKNTISRPTSIEIEGACENNLRNIDVSIPHGKTTVLTGISGSGKSTLAFDIIFAEGQRRFMESMSPYARQFVEQLPKPHVHKINGLAPTVAIEQRVTRGTSKSTVATITEVAQYLRLLFARIGKQYNPASGNAVTSLSLNENSKNLEKALGKLKGRKKSSTYLGATLVRGRKGHYQPLADWTAEQEYPFLVCDGQWVRPEQFIKLDRYREHDIDLILCPVEDLSPSTRKRKLKAALELGKGSAFLTRQEEGVLTLFSLSRVDPETGEAFPELDPKHFSWNSPKGWCPTCRGRGVLSKKEAERPDNGENPICPDCQGTRLNEISRSVYLPLPNGQKKNLPEILSESASGILSLLGKLTVTGKEATILKEILPEITERLSFMSRIGLEYLTLDRATQSLSGGEAQRIRLAAQLGSNLTGVLYVLDEPTIGLHAQDNLKLIESVRQLKERGNTVLIVEHDEDMIRSADRVIDIGPGAGRSGGELIASTTPTALLRKKHSLTGQMLKHPQQHPSRGQRRSLPTPWEVRRNSRKPDWMVLKKVVWRNWKGDTVYLPRQRLTCVCGVSGAGKSTLIRDVLVPAARTCLLKKKASVRLPGRVAASGLAGIQRVVEMDQSPIGKTSRSTPATYIGAWDIIRDAFSRLPEARLRGYTAGTFSFNSAGGRCETCKGAGHVKLEMNFLPDTYAVCDSCNGKRYRADLLELHWRSKSIADILQMSFEEAADFFAFDQRIQSMMKLMVATGLGYLQLGQSSPTLSGGEAQRMKIVSEMVRGIDTRNVDQHNLYILEEPTIGLHLSDCRKLTDVLHKLVDDGHTVIVIEHHPDILAEADYLIEIGPGGGENGGRVLFQGVPENILNEKNSPTSPFLADRFCPANKP